MLSVANAVLTDRSVGRIATGERFNLENIDASAIVDEGGMRYYMYESSRVGAPRTPRPKVRRHGRRKRKLRPLVARADFRI